MPDLGSVDLQNGPGESLAKQNYQPTRGSVLRLAALLEQKKLKIADPVPVSKGYNRDYYIRRTLRHQNIIKEDIKWDMCRSKFHDVIVRNEEDFREVSQNNPNENVHWLQEDKSGKLYWQQTQGCLETVRRHIDTDSSNRYTDDDLVQQAENQRVILISDTAGMGKSTILTHLSKKIKEKFPTKWVERIDLNDHVDVLRGLKEKEIDSKKAIEFVSEKLLKLKPGLDLELFKLCCKLKQKLRIVIMLDGFDEISPFYNQKVFDLVQALRQTAVEQLWVTTRPHLKEELEDKLQQLSYTLEPFSEENKVEFLTTFWSQKKWFIDVGNRPEDGNSKLENYAKELCKKLGQSISDKDRNFTGIPLQCQMLAEAFDKEVETFYSLSDGVSGLTLKLDIVDIYRKFIKRKYNIYHKEKSKAPENNVIEKQRRKRESKSLTQDHQLLALKVLFTEDQVTSFRSGTNFSFEDEELNKVGIAEIKNEGKLRFIHRTFAEFFVADFFVNELKEPNKASPRVQNCLLRDAFLKAEYRVVRAFIDGLLSKSGRSGELLKQYGNCMRDMWDVGVQILYCAAVEGNANIVGFLLDSLQVAQHKDTLVQLLEAQYKDRKTAWHVAGMWGNLQVLKKLWEWAKVNLTREEFHRKYLLARDSKGKTAWHVAAEESKLEVLQQLWEWSVAENINDKLLLVRDDSEQTLLHVAAERNNSEEFKKLWKWATENLTAEELKNLLLAKDHLDHTVFNVTANRTNKEDFQKLWDYAIEKLKLTTEEIQILFSFRR